ncbi:HEPN domain-containing protein [Cellulophaga fucicola]|nr:HEPN domain-containing protein [Cellulophaga fucicola]
MKIDIIDFNDAVNLKHFGIEKISYQNQCWLFDLESFELNEEKEVTAWKPKPVGERRNNLKSLADYSDSDRNELIGSEYYLRNEFFDDIELILEAFHLYKLGNIVATFSQNTTVEITHFNYPRFRRIPQTGICQISVKDLPEIEKLFLKLKKIENKKILLNIERLKYDADNLHHSFINLVGILESLLTNNDTGELKFRFSLYVNHILRNSINSDIKIDFPTAKKLYDVRSSLVHKGESKKYSIELYLLLKDITREILVWHIENENYNVEKDFMEYVFEKK